MAITANLAWCSAFKGVSSPLGLDRLLIFFVVGGWYIIELDDVSPINDKRLVTYRSGSFQVVKSSIISDEV